jgi:hypothetical protein
MAKVRLYGETSGYVDLKAPDVAGDVTITLPNESGAFATEPYVDAAIAGIPEIAGIGSNVVQTVKTDTFSTTSTSYVEVDGLTVTITPSSATAKILLIAQVNATNDNDTGDQHQTLIKFSGGNTSTYIGDAGGSGNIQAVSGMGAFSDVRLKFQTPSLSMVFLDSPGTAAAVTYKVEIRVSGSTARVNSTDATGSRFPRTASSITAIEVAA